MHYTGRNAAHAPILRNSTFASLSPRTAASRSLTISTFRGNFARSQVARDWRRHHHRFGFVLGFVGPLFWPYAYDDFIDYTFWPYAYDTFWPYAFDDVYEGIYGAYAPEYYAPENAYAYAGAAASESTYASVAGAPGPAQEMAANSQICSGQAQGLTNFPIERIAQQVRPDQHQQQLLDDLKAVTAKAVDVLQAACPNELPSTPTGRLATMQTRVKTMLKAVELVRPALDQFYQSLSDEQKERFNLLDQTLASETSGHQTEIAKLCGQNTGHAGLPIDQIERSMHLTKHQDAALQNLNDASAKAADILRASCQPQQTLTPTGRLAEMQTRLTSMLQALDSVQAPLATFYASLDDEQKARFDQLGARPA